MTNLFKKNDEQVLLGAYIDPEVAEELDVRALLIKNSRSEVIRYAITILQDLQPMSSVLDGLVQELVKEWNDRVQKKRSDRRTPEKLEKSYEVFLEEVRAEMARKKIHQRYTDRIILGLKKAYALGLKVPE